MKKLIFIILTLSLISCSQEIEKKDLRVIDLAGNVGKGRVVNLSEIAESIEYIPLETNDKSILGPTRKALLFERGNLYIGQLSGEFKIFNQSGEFIKVFNRYGRGPQEYTNVSALHIEPSTNNLIISTIRKVIEYDQNGNFVKEVASFQNEENKKFSPNNCYKINKNLYLLTLSSNKDRYTFGVTDSLFNIKYFIKQSLEELRLIEKYNLMPSHFSFHY